MNIAGILEEQARRVGDRPAIVERQPHASASPS